MKRNNKVGGPRGGGLSTRAQLSDGPAYRGQQKTKLVIEGSSVLLSTTVTTGIIAYNFPVEVANITGFATRFGSTFDEYRTLGCDFRITPVSASTGISKAWFDEKSAVVPTANESTERTSITLPNTNASGKAMRVLRWKARDLLDLEYSPTSSTTVNPVTFKIYTDLANYGAPAAVTPLWLVQPVFHLEFRGIKST